MHIRYSSIKIRLRRKVYEKKWKKKSCTDYELCFNQLESDQCAGGNKTAVRV